VLGERWYRPDTTAGLYVLAHELAHVVQKRRGATGCRSASAHALEAEAHAAAAAITQGKRFSCQLGDTPAAPRFWGVAGHYYTAYLVLLAAGADAPVAFELATLAQMPDQVDVLDATYMGEQMPSTIPPPKSARQLDRIPSTADLQREIAADRMRQDLRKRIREVQEGIHALTGRSAEEETRIRRDILVKATFGSLEFGVGIHSYGDSFAHRRMDGSGTMYKGPLGHLVHLVENDTTVPTNCRVGNRPWYSDFESFADSFWARLDSRCSLNRRYLHNPREPDFLYKRRDLYREYGLTLYDIVRQKLPSAKPRLTRDDLGAALDQVSWLTDDSAQIAKLREIATNDVKVPMNSQYRPEEEGKNGTLPWSQYFMNHQQNGKPFPPNLLVNTQDWARQCTDVQ
jgi:hypothetical protein